MDNPMQTAPDQPNNNTRNIVIGVGIFFLVMCCCAIIVIAGLAIMGPVVSSTYSTINETMESPSFTDFPTISPGDFPTLDPDATLPGGASNPIPKGGRGNEIERASAWSYVILQAAFDSCTLSNPKADDMSITVKEEPNSDGVWVEEWTVNCDGGDKKVYTVTFKPGSNGNTDVSVK